MITGQQIFDNAKQNGLLYGGERELKHFDYIAQFLNENEKLLLGFSSNSIYDPKGNIIWGGTVAFAITDKRILYGRKAMLGGYKTVDLDNINDITKSNWGIIDTRITIDTYKESIEFNVGKLQNDDYYKKILEALEKYRENKSASQSQSSQTIIQNNISIADEILKFKQLLDMGVLTQEEFDMKKKELLNQSMNNSGSVKQETPAEDDYSDLPQI